MAIFKEFSGEDIKSNRSFLNQLVDIVNDDISGSNTRKQYQVYVTGGVGPGVTSSLFQTTFDQDFTLQTANPVFDMTFGFFSASNIVTNLNPTIDLNGKYIFPSQSLMMREKMDIYRLFAQNLLGSADKSFEYTSTTNKIDNALFISFKRLFARDQIKRETFAIKLSPSAAYAKYNLEVNSTGPPKILSDIGSTANIGYSFGGQVSSIVDSSNTSNELGLLYIDKGIAVLDIDKVFDQVTKISGTIKAMSPSGYNFVSASFNEFLTSASIDQALDHICSTRFTGSSATSITFQNTTNINSTLFFCRLGADEFNYSSNPTFTDENNRIVVIDQGQETTQRTFTFVSTIGLYDANDNLLGVGKLSRPVLKDDERDLTLKVRIDYISHSTTSINNKKKIKIS